MNDLQENRSSEIVAVMVTFLVVTWISVILRCYVRFWISKAFGFDDWFMMGALATFSLFGGFIFASVQHGLGRHDASLSQDQDIKAREYYALSTVVYIACMAFVKLSIALLMLRIMVERRYTNMVKVSMVAVSVWTLAEFFFVIFQCKPVQFQWNYTIEGGKCTGNFVAAALAFSVMSIVSDWFYALLPIPMLWPVKMSIQSKISVALILSLGVIASIGPFIRLKYLINIKSYDDLLYSNTDALIWTIIEPGLGMTCASMATFRPLLGLLKAPGFSSRGDTSRSRQTNTIGGTRGNDGSYICFQNLATLSQASRTVPRTSKSEWKGQTELYENNGSEEFILPPDKIMKTVGVVVIHDKQDGD